MAKVLILDQSKSIRNTLRERLEFEGIASESAENEAAASVLCERIPFDLIISDHETRLPESDVPFIVLSSEATVDSAIKALRNGAQDYLTKPIDMNRLMQSIRQTLEQAAEAPRTAAKAKAKRSSAGHTEEIIGTSEQMQHVRRLIDKVAPCDARVLITGENGTGKELVARWLHAKSNRAGAPFVEVNCAAIPSELIESELFGHERGAFTSAIKQRKGKFEQASGGTLFMDEIGDMSLAAQAKVLRALQENRISRVGSDKDIEVNVRVIAATNKNLREEIRKGIVDRLLGQRLGKPGEVLNGFVWRFLFSRSVIQNHGMHFLGAYLEDELFLLEYFCYANKLAMTDKAVYHYLQNPASVTRRYLPDYMQTFHTFMKAKEALAQRLELGRDQPLWRENSCWAGLLIAVGNEFAASNAAPLAEKRRRVRGICQLPEMASAICQIHPEGLGRNKQIVADLIRRRQYFALSMLYGLKNRKG